MLKCLTRRDDQLQTGARLQVSPSANGVGFSTQFNIQIHASGDITRRFALTALQSGRKKVNLDPGFYTTRYSSFSLVVLAKTHRRCGEPVSKLLNISLIGLNSGIVYLNTDKERRHFVKLMIQGLYMTSCIDCKKNLVLQNWRQVWGTREKVSPLL